MASAAGFLGCFSLPLYPDGAVAALVALSFLPLLATRLYAVPAWLWAVPAGWTAALLARPGFPAAADSVDLALTGPILAMGAAIRPRREWQDAFLLGGLVCAAAILAQMAVGRAVPLRWLGTEWTWGRADGTLGNPNVAGAYLAGVLPTALAADWRRPPKYAALGLLAAALVGTGSRGAWIAACLAAAHYCWQRRSPRLPLVLAAILAAAIFPWPPGGRLFAAIAGSDTAVAARAAIWRRALGAWLERPLSGWGGFGPMGGTHPHQLVLEILVRGGLLAAAGFFPAALACVRSLSGRPKPAREAAAASSILAVLVFGLADAVLTQPALAGLAWISLGLVTGRGRSRRSANEDAF